MPAKSVIFILIYIIQIPFIMIFIFIQEIFLDKTDWYHINTGILEDVDECTWDTIFYCSIVDFYYRNHEHLDLRIAEVYISIEDGLNTSGYTFLNVFINMFEKLIYVWKNNFTTEIRDFIDILNSYLKRYQDHTRNIEAAILESQVSSDNLTYILLDYFLNVVKKQKKITRKHKEAIICFINNQNTYKCFKVRFIAEAAYIFAYEKIILWDIEGINFADFLTKLKQNESGYRFYINFSNPMLYFVANLLSNVNPALTIYNGLFVTDQLESNEYIQSTIKNEIYKHFDILELKIMEQLKKSPRVFESLKPLIYIYITWI